MCMSADDYTVFLPALPAECPLSQSLPDTAEVNQQFSSLILSASGWRKVFVESGNEEDSGKAIGDANAVIAALMADTFASYLAATPGFGRDVLVAMDTRPTGTAIADIFCRVLLARGFTVRFPGIAAAPEIMARARSVGAFAYISASHNPVGHNGVKFGCNDGGVFDRDTADILANSFRARLAAPHPAEEAAQLLAACDQDALSRVYSRSFTEKKAALASYEAFSREVIGGSDPDRIFGNLRKAASDKTRNGHPISLLADFNGSARAISIDRAFIEAAGFHLSVMNEIPGHIAHRIVPEGESLRFCADRMACLRKTGSGPEKHTLFGYVPDCDGDRGNIVFWDENSDTPAILEAQEVFALSAISELAFLVYSGQITAVPGRASEPASEPASEFACAIAVNGPTSLRIDSIARAFGVTVARAEVGEANVVNLARALRDNGIQVRFLGEGSNGGNITHPAAVRDPLNTVFALLKLLTIDDTGEKKGLFHIWCALSGQEESYHDGFTFADIRRTLPRFVTTSVFEPHAQLKISGGTHAELKQRFRSIFLREWNRGSFPLARENESWEWKAVTYNGTETRELGDDFGVSGTGGLKILFSRDKADECAFVWMRGSGTEPVFRIMADVEGSDPEKERILREWFVRMVLEADGQIQ